MMYLLLFIFFCFGEKNNNVKTSNTQKIIINSDVNNQSNDIKNNNKSSNNIKNTTKSIINHSENKQIQNTQNNNTKLSDLKPITMNDKQIKKQFLLLFKIINNNKIISGGICALLLCLLGCGIKGTLGDADKNNDVVKPENNDDIKLKNDDIKPKNNGVKPKNNGVLQNNDDIKRKNNGVGPENNDVPQGNKIKIEFQNNNKKLIVNDINQQLIKNNNKISLDFFNDYVTRGVIDFNDKNLLVPFFIVNKSLISVKDDVNNELNERDNEEYKDYYLRVQIFLDNHERNANNNIKVKMNRSLELKYKEIFDIDNFHLFQIAQGVDKDIIFNYIYSNYSHHIDDFIQKNYKETTLHDFKICNAQGLFLESKGNFKLFTCGKNCCLNKIKTLYVNGEMLDQTSSVIANLDGDINRCSCHNLSDMMLLERFFYYIKDNNVQDSQYITDNIKQENKFDITNNLFISELKTILTSYQTNNKIEINDSYSHFVSFLLQN